MVAFYVDTFGPDTIVIRLNGPSFGVFDRNREMIYQKILRDQNIADYLLGVFKNGIDAVFRRVGTYVRNVSLYFLHDELSIILKSRNLKN